MSTTDSVFNGSIPQLYETYMVPMLFESYAADLVRRIAHYAPTRILELAAGTGVVTRRLASTLSADAAIVATDLNQPMIDCAAAIGTCRPVTWQVADATQLPFGDAEFDLVVCQFGVMFFPDKTQAFAQAHRVLRPGGHFLFNVWDRIEANEFPHEVTRALASLWPENPPRFMERTPHGYGDIDVAQRDLHQAGFTAASDVETISGLSIAASPRDPAVAFCQGTPLRAEIESRGGVTLREATIACEQALARRFGSGRIEGRIRAHVVATSR